MIDAIVRAGDREEGREDDRRDDSAPRHFQREGGATEALKALSLPRWTEK